MLVVRGAAERRVEQLEVAVIAAWRGAGFAALASIGKLPELDEVVGTKKRGPVDQAFTTAEARRWEAIDKAKAEEVPRG